MWPRLFTREFGGVRMICLEEELSCKSLFSVIPFFIRLCSKAKTNWRILEPISGDIGDSLLNHKLGLPTGPPAETSPIGQTDT